MKKQSEMIDEKLVKFNNSINDFLEKYIEIKYDPMESGDIVFIGMSDYSWRDLNTEGKQCRAKIYKDINIFFELIEVILNQQPEEHIDDYKNCVEDIINILLQQVKVWDSSISKIKLKIDENFNTIRKIVTYQYSDLADIHIIVPDTNALLSNTDIENWKFSNVENFKMILLPTVLQELDQLKINHRNPEVRNKTSKLIKKIKEYRRRGKLTNGVKLKGSNSIKAVAIEPKMNKTLSWLDPLNNDDRVIASFIEVCRDYISSNVVLITADINVQNKAEFALLKFEEPPIKTINN